MAQKTHDTEWYFGAGGNFNTAWIIRQNTYGEPEMKYKITPTYAANVILGFDYSEHWGLKMELGYAVLGQKYADSQYSLPAKRTITLDYFLLPVLIKYRTGDEMTKFYIMAGPQFGLLLSANQVYTRNGVDAPVFNNPDVGAIDVSKKDIKDRYTQAAGFIRMDLGIELRPSNHFMMDIGLTGAYAVTDLNNAHWRFHDIHGGYQISHDFYAGLNVGFMFNTGRKGKSESESVKSNTPSPANNTNYW
jgi:hypothetical protein